MLLSGLTVAQSAQVCPTNVSNAGEAASLGNSRTSLRHAEPLTTFMYVASASNVQLCTNPYSSTSE